MLSTDAILSNPIKIWDFSCALHRIPVKHSEYGKIEQVEDDQSFFNCSVIFFFFPQLLTPREVQGLLGLNLPELAQWQYRAPVRDWIQLQKQSELDKLHIGLTGGTQEGYINRVTPKFPGSFGLLMVGFERFISGLQKGLKVFKECRAVLESHWEHPC